jgi:hypothetical protein
MLRIDQQPVVSLCHLIGNRRTMRIQEQPDFGAASRNCFLNSAPQRFTHSAILCQDGPYAGQPVSIRALN